MGSRKQKALASIVVGVVLVAIPALPAAADDAAVNGWTEEELVSAAMALGVDETWARAAWDAGLVESIPVTTEQQYEQSTRQPTEDEAATLEAQGEPVPLAVVSTSHDQIWYNAFGGALTRITMHKSFNATGLSVSAISDYITTGSGFGWYFNGVVNDWDAYSTEGGRPNGGHTSYTMGLFCNDIPAPSCVNQWVQIKGLWNGVTEKSGGYDLAQ